MVLSPQAKDFLCASVCEVLAQYHVSPSVAERLAGQIAMQFNDKILRHLEEMNKVSQMAILKEALDQCQTQRN